LIEQDYMTLSLHRQEIAGDMPLQDNETLSDQTGPSLPPVEINSQAATVAATASGLKVYLEGTPPPQEATAVWSEVDALVDDRLSKLGSAGLTLGDTDLTEIAELLPPGARWEPPAVSYSPLNGIQLGGRSYDAS
jgi:hypothetical protein